MDRRKLRRLLASSSFVAILIAGNEAQAQAPDLTNPAGSTTTFLRVDPGEVFDDVVNQGLITNAAGEAGIRVVGTGTVLGEIENDGTILITDSTSALGILVRGTSALVADGIENDGLIDIDVSGSGTGLFGVGIQLTGTNNVVGATGADHAIRNDADGTIDVRVHSFSSVTASKANATVSGLASGIFIGTDVTHSGGVFNFGVIDVLSSNTAIARGLGAPAVSAQAVARGTAYGVNIVSQDLNGGFHNNGQGAGPGAGPGEITVRVDNNASALSFTNGTGNRNATAAATATGTARGVFIDVATITVEVYHDGVIDVDSVQSALARATA
ncbi:MAG TPA: hypothetical protein VJL84_02020, partial [Kiloniellales bacterium]|nr:hypothetical protein [Kiloniellales bacterium]